MSTPAAARPTVSAPAEARYAFLEAFQPGDPESGWLLLYVCEAHALVKQRIRQALEHDDIGSGARRLHDPLRAPAWALPALAENYAGIDPANLTEQQLRTAIEERPRLRRCTTPAFVSAVKQTLTGDRTVRLLENDTGPSRATFITRPQETPDPAATLAAGESQTPWWVQLTHVISDSPTWNEGNRPWDAATGPWDTATPSDVN